MKRRRSRSLASGAGLQLIATTRSSSVEALPRIFDFARLVESFKSFLSSRLLALDLKGEIALPKRTRVLLTVWAVREPSVIPRKGFHP